MERRLRTLLAPAQPPGRRPRPATSRPSGETQEEFVAELRTEAAGAVKADLALQAVADAEGIEVTDDEVDAEIADLAEQREQEARPRCASELESEDQLPAVRSGIRKTKALEWLIDHTEFVDEEGQVIDRSQLTPARAPTSPEAADAADASSSRGEAE